MFETIIAALKSKLGELPTLRKPSNGTKYVVLDALLSKERSHPALYEALDLLSHVDDAVSILYQLSSEKP